MKSNHDIEQSWYSLLIELNLLWNEILRERSYFEIVYALDPEFLLDEEFLEFVRASLQSSLDHSLRTDTFECRFSNGTKSAI